MKDYIEREAARELLAMVLDDWKFKYAADRMDGIPAADVRPVVRGKWIDTGSGQECSACGEFQAGYDNYRNFCPNCGADMRGEN